MHHKAEEYLHAYMAAAGLKDDPGSPLWRMLTKERLQDEMTGRKDRRATANRMTRVDVFRMTKRRVRDAELGGAANCHKFRATGITAYLLNGGVLERAQAIAAHESPRTTKLYDPTSEEITVADIDKIDIRFQIYMLSARTRRRHAGVRQAYNRLTLKDLELGERRYDPAALPAG